MADSNLDNRKTIGDRITLFITDMFGSILFLCLCLLFFIVWVVWNLGMIPGFMPFDRYPFPELELIVSVFAVVLSVSVLISQKRQGRIEQIRQQVEFEVNVKAEKEITKILTMLHEIQKNMGIDKPDGELEDMKEETDLKALHHKIDDKIANDR